MRNYYKDGTVQNLAEQALGLAAHFDDDATVPVVFFSTDIDGTADIDLTNYEGRIAELHAGLGHMGRTNYHWAVNAVIEHYKKSGSTAPAFVIFQTDGAPTSKPAAEKALCEAAGLPSSGSSSASATRTPRASTSSASSTTWPSRRSASSTTPASSTPAATRAASPTTSSTSS